MRKIRCTLGTIDKAIDALESYKKSLQQKQRKMLDRIADVASESTQAGFNGATYDGDYSVSVFKEFEDDATVYVVADGEAVAFIEFGTGAVFPDSHPNATEDWMQHGAWSLSPQGKGLWDSEDGWYYAHGKKTRGNPANMCLYNAARDAESQVARIAKEVFGK